MPSLSTIRRFVIGAALALAPAASFGGVFISVNFAPPVLPVYTQPLCPGDGYLWTPGYWAYDDGGYFWVPGVWVEPPTVGYLWTPPYWGFAGGAYGFHPGYWGPHVGFYGGVNYGFGFFGSGYYGGRWNGNHFAYNTAVNNVNVVNVHNTYIDRTVINNVNVNNRTSFNGGNGIQARPNQQEMAFERERHIDATPVQQSHFQAAHAIPANFARNNGGNPQVAAIPRPGAMQQAVPARGFVGARVDNQQQRIANGVGSGQLNPRETGRLENREANINQTVNQDRRTNGGTLTPQERQNINQRQNNVSNSIYQDRRNDATQPTARGGFGAQGQAAQPNQVQRPAAQPAPQPQQRPDYQQRQQYQPQQQQQQRAPQQQYQARPEAAQPRPAAPPQQPHVESQHPQAAPAPRAEGHEGGGKHERR